MKYIAIIDDKFISNFRTDDNGRTLVVCDERGFTRAMHLTPLPEHGRLIDADALTKRLEDMANLAWNIRVGSSTGLEDAIDVIDDAPTVIEGDKHEAEE